MGWIIFGFAFMSLFGFWTYLLYKDEIKKIDEHYIRTCFHESLIEPIKENNSEETKPENKEKQKIKIT